MAKKSHFASISSLQIGHVASTRWSWSNGTATSLLGVIGPEFGRGVPKKGWFARPRYEFRIFVRHFPRCFGKVSLNSTANKNVMIPQIQLRSVT